MLRGRFQRFTVCLVIVVGIGLGVFVGPGIRHRHDGGDAAHTHSAARSHSHSHSHGHSHGHQHSHEHDHSHGHLPRKRDDQVQQAPAAHIHMTVFGIEVTLPDFLRDDPAPLTTSTGSALGQQRSERGQRVQLSTPAVPSQLIQFAFRIKGIPAQRLCLDADSGPGGWFAAEWPGNAGIDRHAPPDPPPRCV